MEHCVGNQTTQTTSLHSSSDSLLTKSLENL